MPEPRARPDTSRRATNQATSALRPSIDASPSADRGRRSDPSRHGPFALGVDAFPDDAARRGFLSLLAKTTVAFRWHVLAYCLLPNHHHVLVETDEPNLGPRMRRLHGHHAARMNDRLGRARPVCATASTAAWSTATATSCRRRSTSTPTPSRRASASSAAEWRWSSYRANAGLAEPLSWHHLDRFYRHVGAGPAMRPPVYREAVELASRILEVEATLITGDWHRRCLSQRRLAITSRREPRSPHRVRHLRCQTPSRSRAMTMRWISLVPS